MKSEIKFEIIDNISDFYNLEMSWIKLYDNLENKEIFYNWVWIENYIKRIKKESVNLFVVVGKENEEVVVIAPFCIENRGFGIFKRNILKFIIDTTADYQCILIRKNYNQYSILKHLLETIINDNTIDIITLNNISCRERQGILINEIGNKLKEKVVCYKKLNNIAPYVNFDEFINTRNKNRFTKLIRKEKKVDKDNLINIRINSQWDREIWYKLVEIHKNTWEDSIYKKKDYMEFYENLFEELYKNGYLDFSYVTYKDELISGSIGFKASNKISAYNIYNNCIAKDFSMGYIMMNKIIKYYNKDYKAFDMLMGNEEYKFYFTDLAINICNYTIIKKKNYIVRLLMKIKEFIS